MENVLDEFGSDNDEEFECFWDMVEKGRAAIESAQTGTRLVQACRPPEDNQDNDHLLHVFTIPPRNPF